MIKSLIVSCSVIVIGICLSQVATLMLDLKYHIGNHEFAMILGIGCVASLLIGLSFLAG